MVQINNDLPPKHFSSLTFSPTYAPPHLLLSLSSSLLSPTSLPSFFISLSLSVYSSTKPSRPPPSRPPLFSLAGLSLFLLLQQIPRPPPSRQPLPHPPLSLQSSLLHNRSRRNPLCFFATDAWQVTAVDSGRRVLQFLGLDDEEKSSIGFDGLKVDLIII
ncbi:hypothetical protein ACSBR1_005335 [Camellia fascicularis]